VLTPFKRALAFTSRAEGGYVDDPDDDGGPTSHGVTQATFDRWRTRQGLPLKLVAESTPEEREQLYFEEFWQRTGCYRFGPALAISLFDTAVNPGVDRAIALLQTVVGTKPDSVFGPKTLGAISLYGELKAALDLQVARRGYYVARRFAKPKNAKYLGGWVARCDALLAEIGAELS
jgi:lysozyme family protein